VAAGERTPAESTVGAGRPGASNSTIRPNPLTGPGGGLPPRETYHSDLADSSDTRTRTGSGDSTARSPGRTDGSGLEPSRGSSPRGPVIPVPTPNTDSTTGYPKTHVAAAGEGYWALAQKYYKNPKLWPHIEKANGGRKVIAGKPVTIPAPPAEAEPAPATSRDPGSTSKDSVSRNGGVRREAPTDKPRSGAETSRAAGSGSRSSGSASTSYVVKKGETLTILAKRFYNDPGKSHLIEDANDSLKYRGLREGEKIVIPAQEK
jgi:nucleoid-associated protein YgaU